MQPCRGEKSFAPTAHIFIAMTGGGRVGAAGHGRHGPNVGATLVVALGSQRHSPGNRPGSNVSE